MQGIKIRCDLNRKIYKVLEVSLRIRFPIHRAVFGVDFGMLLNPNLKKDFIYVGNAFYCANALVIQT